MSRAKFGVVEVRQVGFNALSTTVESLEVNFQRGNRKVNYRQAPAVLFLLLKNQKTRGKNEQHAMKLIS